MINVKDKLVYSDRVLNSYIVAKIGFYDKEAKSSISSATSTNKPLCCDLSKTYNNTKTTIINYITCEPNRVKLDGSFAFINFKSGSSADEEIAYWSGTLSDENGNFDYIPYIEYTFNKQIGFTFLTLYFQEVCADLDINYYLKNELIYTRQIRGNNSLSFETIDMSNTNPIQYFDKIIIEFIRTKEPYRRVKFNEIDFGSYEIIGKDKITDLNIIKECSIDSSDLPSCSCNITIRDDNGDYDILNPNNKLRFLQERQEISLYHYVKSRGFNNQEVSLGTFYLKNFNYSNRKLELECYDITYFMNQTYYESPYYNGISAAHVLSDIFKKMNFDNKKYYIGSMLGAVHYMYGYIPVVSFKEALRIVAEACRARIYVDNYGVIQIKSEGDIDNSTSKGFQLNEISENNPTQNLYNNVIDITEYNYIPVYSDTEIYNRMLNKGEYIIQFTKFPIMYDMYKDDFNKLKADNGYKDKYNILSLGACACTINVLEDNIEVKLLAKYYESRKVIKRFKKDTINSNDEYSIGEIDNTFITLNENNSSYRPTVEKLADWKLKRQEISYSFKSNIMPYLELNDRCSQTIPYKDINGNYILKYFNITRLEINLGIKQNIEGE